MAVLLVGLFSLPALAQYTKDKAANQKIDEAINQHYLMMELDKAEAILTGVVQACADKCSPQTKAKAWMYVGIVRGSGRGDQAGAGEAFATAKAFDPGVQLDAAIATPETKATFDATGGGSAAAPAETPVATAPAAAEAVPGDMDCTPTVRELETNRPLPVSCTTTEEDATVVVLHFQEFGASDWSKITMKKAGEFWQAEIPCSATATAGPLSWFVTAEDSDGELWDSLGSRNQPVVMDVKAQVASAPPSFPGQEAPVKCASASAADCPPDFPGCDTGAQQCGDKDWGASCNNSTECKCGLLCVDGACETAPSCDTDSDCDSGACVDGYCSAPGGEVEAPTGPYKKNWLGIDVGYDLAIFGGTDVCYSGTQDAQHFKCFTGDQAYPLRNPDTGDAVENPYPGTGIGTGVAPAGIRIMLAYEYAMSPNFTLGARAGYAINGAPEDFFPIHGELRASYYFGSGLSGSGIRPYVFAGGGVAQVDGKVSADVLNCPLGEFGTWNPGTGTTDRCDPNATDPSVRPELEADSRQNLTVDVYKQMGIGFVAVGGGMVFAFTDNLGIKANVNGMVMLPKTGFVIEPSLGFVYGL